MTQGTAMENIDLKQLQKEIPHKWRIQSYSKNKPAASCIAYIDARDVMDLLDEVVGPENWQDEYQEIDGKLFCGLSIIHKGEWVTKWDTGSESNVEKEKGEVSDAFKRAAVKWGVGRFLYSLPVRYVGANQIKTEKTKPWELWPVDDQGKRIYDLTKYLNQK